MSDDFSRMDARLARLPHVMETQVRTAMQASLLLIEADYRRNLNSWRLSGRTQGSITNVIVGAFPNLEGRVGPGVAWGRAFELGRPAGIWPPLGPLISWVKRRGLGGTFSLKTRSRLGSKAVQADQDLAAARGVQRKIFHKGIPAHPALLPAFHSNRSAITRLFQRAGSRVVASLTSRGT